MARYKFYESPNEVICVSTYAKKRVKGVAKCSPNDNFDSDVGRRLAQLRCDVKIAKKRMNRAKTLMKENNAILEMVQKWAENSSKYFCDSSCAYYEAEKALKDFENTLK